MHFLIHCKDFGAVCTIVRVEEQWLQAVYEITDVDAPSIPTWLQEVGGRRQRDNHGIYIKKSSVFPFKL